jgi:deazaflavin-dependent oxidoreductase (nitroreductase family)
MEAMRVEVPKAMHHGKFREVNADVVAEYRANAGRLTTAFVGVPILLLNHHGAKTRTPYTSPLAFTRDRDTYIIVASMGGAPVNPQWFRNVVAHPDVSIEVGADTIPVRARVATGEERARLYRSHADEISNFDDYQARTTREIPVVVLERREGA